MADVRLIKTRGGQGKLNVYAYIEYSTSEPVPQALLLDHSQFNDRSIYVSPCNSTTANKSKVIISLSLLLLLHSIMTKQLFLSPILLMTLLRSNWRRSSKR